MYLFILLFLLYLIVALTCLECVSAAGLRGFFSRNLLKSLQNRCVYLFLPLRRKSARALNTCVSQIRLIKFDEFKKRGEIIMS